MNTQIYEEASDWLVKHRTGGLGDSDKHAFDGWLRVSPEHVRAYFDMSAVWEDTALLDPNKSAAAPDLIARANTDGNVVHLTASPRATPNPPASLSPPTKPSDRSVARESISAMAVPNGPAIASALLDPTSQPGNPAIAPAASPGPWAPAVTARGIARNPARRALIAAACVIACAGGAFAWLTRYPTYTTAIGELRSFTLEDGSTVTLNTHSRIKVRLSAHQRDVDLLEGQALFRVTQNEQRPFIVHGENTAVRVLGTEFDVYKHAAGTTVTVLTGRVSVAQDSKPNSPSVDVAPGEQVNATPATLGHPAAVNASAVTAWTQHRLVFDATPLPEVAAEFNRYNARLRLIVDDPRLAAFHVNGTFSSQDPQVLLSFLRLQPDITVDEMGSALHIAKK